MPDSIFTNHYSRSCWCSGWLFVQSQTSSFKYSLIIRSSLVEDRRGTDVRIGFVFFDEQIHLANFRVDFIDFSYS